MNMKSSPGSQYLPLAGLVLLLLLLQAVFFAVTFLYFRHEIKQMNENYIRNNIACLVGDDLSYVFQPANINDVDDQNEPCREVRKQVQRVIRMILEEKYGHEITSLIKDKVSEVLPVSVAEKQVYTGPMIAAHVTGHSKKDTSIIKNLQKFRRGMIVGTCQVGVSGTRVDGCIEVYCFLDHILVYKDWPNIAVLSNDQYHGHKITEWSNNTLSDMNSIKVQNGEMVIARSGYYYIYAQTYFRNQDPEGKVKQLVQHIYKRTSYRFPIALMKNVKTTCWAQSTEYELYSIYQGGVFKLNENDRVFVTVSHKNMLDMEEKATFFGAFLVF